MKSLISGLAVGMAVLLCGTVSIAPAIATSMESQQPPMTVAYIAQGMSSQACRWLQDAANSSHGQIKLSQVAMHLSQSENVKSFARNVIAQNEAALVSLRLIAENSGVFLSETLDAEHQDEVDDLARAPQVSFDAVYFAQLSSNQSSEIFTLEQLNMWRSGFDNSMLSDWTVRRLHQLRKEEAETNSARNMSQTIAAESQQKQSPTVATSQSTVTE